MNPEIEKTKQVCNEELATPEWEGEPAVAFVAEGQPTAESVIGTVIESYYQIEEIIGKGGMSSVYKARHQLLKKDFAVKMLHPHLVADNGSQKRFHQEAQAVSALDHPHIIRVSSFGVSRQGLPYIIMDYLEGESLAERIQHHRYSVPDTLKIFVQTCRALAHAHAKGIVHRDVKPSNIMLVDFEGDRDFVKIVDFGIAKLLPQEGEQVHRLTQTGEIFGSPLYMCPEQWLGKGVDTRSDVYSLGCVLYEILCAQAPFHSNNVFETMNKHLTDLPPPMSIKGAPPALVERLETIVFKALEKEPDKRWQSMKEFAQVLSSMEEELRAGTVGRSVIARLTRHQRKFKKLFSDNWKPYHTLMAAAFIPVAALGGLWYSLDLASFGAQVPLKILPWSPAVTAKKKEEPPADFQDRLRNSYHFIHLAMVRGDSPEELRDLWKKRARTCERWGLLTEAVFSRAQELELEGKISSMKSDDYCRIAEELVDDLISEGSPESYREADKILQVVLQNRSAHNYANSKTLILAGDVKNHLRSFSDAETVFEELVRDRTRNQPKAGGFEDERLPYAIALIKLADLKLRNAESYADEAIADSANKAKADLESETAKVKFQQAETFYTQALSNLTQLDKDRKENPDLKIDKALLAEAICRANASLAFVEQQLGKFDKAKDHYLLALPGIESARVDWAKQVLTNYAFVLWRTNNFLEALQIRDRAKRLKAV